VNQITKTENLTEIVNRINTQEDFAAFVQKLQHDFKENPGSWENRDLPSFLEAIAGWVGDMDGYFQNQGKEAPPQPTWKLLGAILLAARVYE
jgi:hypothetical protein